MSEERCGGRVCVTVGVREGKEESLRRRSEVSAGCQKAPGKDEEAETGRKEGLELCQDTVRF